MDDDKKLEFQGSPTGDKSRQDRLRDTEAQTRPGDEVWVPLLQSKPKDTLATRISRECKRCQSAPKRKLIGLVLQSRSRF